MRPLNECQNELIDGKQYTVWLIAPWDDYQLTDEGAYRWQAPDRIIDISEPIKPLLRVNLVDEHARQFGGFRNNNGVLFAPIEHIVVDV